MAAPFFQAWHCSQCAPTQARDGFDVHCFSQVINSTHFDPCHHCNTYTIETREEVTIRPSARIHGSKTIIKTCAHCQDETREYVKLPKHSSSSSSSYRSSGYSSYDNSSYSSSDSSSSYDSGGSSYDSGGGSFGGGESGGGGGGDSW